MPLRFTNTEKWRDPWYSQLKPAAKLLYNYLCDNCDIDGVYEINYRAMIFDLQMDARGIGSAMTELSRRIILSENETHIYLTEFLKDQKNLPLCPENNNAHLGIVKLLSDHCYLFGFEDYTQLLSRGSLAPTQPLIRGIGKGKGKSKGKSKEEGGSGGETWDCSFEVYLRELGEAVERLKSDASWIEKQSRLNPNVDVLLSIEKAVENFWKSEKGWQNKKKSKSKTIDWKLTLANAISLSSNRVYIQAKANHPINQKLSKSKEKLSEDDRF